MLLAAKPAVAQSCTAPPGTAAIDEYCESVPSATGDGGGSTGSPPQSPSTSTVRALDRSGTNGKELNRFLGETATSAHGRENEANRKKPKAGSHTSSGSGGSAGTVPDQQSSNPLGAVQSAVNSGTTIGKGFTWSLIAITLLLVGLAWMRYRRRSTT
jgi:hypothetical protein